MATKKKMLQAAAGQAGGAGLDITEVFSTYLYEGTGAAQTITNGIDLAGEGGITWVKNRDNASADHSIYSTDIGDDKLLATNKTDALNTVNNSLSFTSSGFSLSATNIGYWNTNKSGEDYASWTFRKAPKFFTCVTWTGDGVNGRYIDHNLGVAPGFVVVKRTDSSSYWAATHKDAAPLSLNTNLADNNIASLQNGYVPSGGGGLFATNFRLFAYNGNMDAVNASGGTYVAYLFAHNDGDGEFGPDGDADIIKCGSYSQSSASDVDVDLGFEPQFVIVKRSDDTSQWYILDEMRGFLAGSNSTSSRTLYASLANAEADFTIQKTATGFTWPSGQYGSGTQEYIYIAIRRGPLAQPESGTEVFAIDTAGATAPSPPLWTSGFVTDFALHRTINTANSTRAVSRLTGEGELFTNLTNAEGTDVDLHWDYMNGLWNGSSINSNQYSWMFRRAPGFFDVVAYSGNGSTQNLSHNLTVPPEMMWIKARNALGTEWKVYHSAIGNNKELVLNSNAASGNASSFNNTTPTSSVFSVSGGATNDGAYTYIAYLFATVPGVSKVGSFTGNGGSQTIDCGFTSGARFVLIKRASASSNWLVFDTERGIVSGTDPYLFLDITDAENAYGAFDEIDPHPSGFTFNYNPAGFALNGTGTELIFYAIA